MHAHNQDQKSAAREPNAPKVENMATPDLPKPQLPRESAADSREATSAARGTGRRVPRTLVALLLAPVAGHLVVIAVHVIRHGYVIFGRLDLVVLLLVLAYAWLALRAASRRTSAARLALATYAALVPLIAFECWMRAYAGDERLVGEPVHAIRHMSGYAATSLPGVEGPIELTINSLGLRSPEVSLEQPDVRILCLGGSTTFCYYVSNERTWPWLLQDQLSEKLGREVYVGNAGRPGHLLLHHAYQLQHYRWADRFEWVVVLCGFNDMTLLLHDSYSERVRSVAWEAVGRLVIIPEMNAMYYRQLQIVQLGRSFVRRLSGASVYMDDDARWYEIRARDRQVALRNRTVHEPPSGLARALLQYRNDLKTLLSHRRPNQRLVFLTQPVMYRPDLPEDLQRWLWNHQGDHAYSPAALAEIMDAYNRTLIQFCRDHNLLYVDLASMLSKDTTTLYADCHFNIPGCEKVADILGAFFAAQLRSPEDPSQD